MRSGGDRAGKKDCVNKGRGRLREVNVGLYGRIGLAKQTQNQNKTTGRAWVCIWIFFLLFPEDRGRERDGPPVCLRARPLVRSDGRSTRSFSPSRQGWLIETKH